MHPADLPFRKGESQAESLRRGCVKYPQGEGFLIFLLSDEGGRGVYNLIPTNTSLINRK